MPPIKGVIHGAMALSDALFDKITFETWMLNIAPRVKGSWNLHNALSGTQLDFFVMLSSLGGIVGNHGQSAYAASNTFLDSFAAYRQNLGLPASTIDIGVVEGVGYVAENIGRRAEMETATYIHDRLTEQELLTLVKAAITHPQSWEYAQTVTGTKLIPDKALPVWVNDPKFAHILHAMHLTSSVASDSSDGAITVQQLLKDAASLDAVKDIMVVALIGKLSSLLLLPTEDFDSKKPIIAYGLDSLVTVEFRNWIAVELQAKVPLMELMSSPSIEHLATKIVSKSSLIKKAAPEDQKVDGEEGQKVEEVAQNK